MQNVFQPKDRDRLLNVLFFLVLMIFIVITIYAYTYPENNFDRFIQEKIHDLNLLAVLPFWIRISFFGSFEFLFPAYVIFILISVWRRKVRLGLSVAAVAIGGFLTVEILKELFHRHRPLSPMIPNVTDFSFPSGHSASSLIFSGVLIYSLYHSRLPRSLVIVGICLFVFLTFTTGLSRIVLAVHYPTDVAAGFCIGMLWSISWYRFIKSKKTGSVKKS